MPRTLQQLSRTEVLEATRTFRGELPGVPNPDTAAVARRFDITEATARALRTAATTTPKVVTESTASPTDARANRKGSLAVRLQSQVTAAEAKPINECSIQELHALAAAAGSEAGMFGA